MVYKVRVSKTLRIVLAVFARSREPFYGAELVKETKIGPGTVYPLLIRLRGAGFLRSVTEDGDPSELGRPARTYYELTENGAREAARILGLEHRDKGARAA